MSSEHASNAAEYSVVSLSDRPDLNDQVEMLHTSGWPEFMLRDPVAMAHWDKLSSWFAEDQLCLLIDGQIATVITMVPIRFDADLSELPDRGFDWGVEKAVADHEDGLSSNALMGMQVLIAENFRGQGLSKKAAGEMIAHARRRNCDLVLIPVRPNGKHAYPLIPMEDYLNWKTSDGLIFDNWLRVHERLGGEIIKICHEAMLIPGTIAEWEAWTGLKFPVSGQHIVPFALNPIEIDVENNLGRYVEPNVWVVHRA